MHKNISFSWTVGVIAISDFNYYLSDLVTTFQQPIRRDYTKRNN